MVGIAYNDRTVTIDAGAGQLVFDCDFPLIAAGDVQVWRRRAGVSTQLTLTVDYLVSNLGVDKNARVTLLAGALAGDRYVLYGRRDPERSTQFQSDRAFIADDVEAGLDDVVIVLQELRRDLDRAGSVGAPIEGAALSGGHSGYTDLAFVDLEDQAVAPAAPSAGDARLFKQTVAGADALMVKFSSGAVFNITQPASLYASMVTLETSAAASAAVAGVSRIAAETAAATAVGLVAGVNLPALSPAVANYYLKVKPDGSGYDHALSVGAVSSVAGKTGAVGLVKADVGLGSVDNTPDASKPISAAVAAALAGKAPAVSPNFSVGVNSIRDILPIGAANFTATAPGVAQGEGTGYSFQATFPAPSVDHAPRRVADITARFRGGVWGAEALSVHVGKGGASNDAGALSNEVVTVLTTGRVGVGAGKTAPSTTLDLGGTAGVDGVRFPDGTLQTSAATASATAFVRMNVISGSYFIQSDRNVSSITRRSAGRITINLDAPMVDALACVVATIALTTASFTVTVGSAYSQTNGHLQAVNDEGAWSSTTAVGLAFVSTPGNIYVDPTGIVNAVVFR